MSNASIWNPGSIITATATGQGVTQETVYLAASQTSVTFSNISYTLGANAIYVHLNGVLQVPGQDYTEVSSTSILLLSPAVAGDVLTVMSVSSLTTQTTTSTSAPEIAVAAAITVNVGAVTSDFINITGSDTITSLGTIYVGPKFIRFSGTCTLTNSASLQLPGGINLSVVPGDTCIATPKATAGVSSGWVVSDLTGSTAAVVSRTVWVEDFGAVGDGVTDDTSAINAAIASLPNNGGIVYFSAKNYKITSTVNIGNGTSSALSTKQGIHLIGQGAGTADNETSPVNYGTQITWAGTAGQVMFKWNGPLYNCQMRGFRLDGGTLASTGINWKHVSNSIFEDILVTHWRGDAFYADSYKTTYAGMVTGSNSVLCNLLKASGPTVGYSASGLILGASGAASIGNVDVARWTFRNCEFNWDSSAGSVGNGIVVQFADNCTFYNCYTNRFGGTTGFGLYVIPVPTITTSFPCAINFYACSLIGGTGVFVSSPVWNVVNKFQFLPFVTTDSLVIPANANMIGYTSAGTTFGGFGSGSLFRAAQVGGTQTLTASTWTKVTINSKTYDLDTSFDATTNSRFTPSVAGYYKLSGTVTLSSAPAGAGFVCAIYKNSSSVAISGFKYIPSGASGNAIGASVEDLIYFNGTTDYAELYMWISSVASTVVLNSDSTYTHFDGHFIRT
jgi:hypothetical protein